MPFESALRERAAPRTKSKFHLRRYLRNLRYVQRGKDEVAPAECASSFRIRSQEYELWAKRDGPGTHFCGPKIPVSSSWFFASPDPALFRRAHKHACLSRASVQRRSTFPLSFN